MRQDSDVVHNIAEGSSVAVKESGAFITAMKPQDPIAATASLIERALHNERATNAQVHVELQSWEESKRLAN